MSHPNINFMRVKSGSVDIAINLNLVQGISPIGEDQACIDFGAFSSAYGIFVKI